MDTAQEALFRAMLTDGWFTASDGDVDSPTGYFGYVTNTLAEYCGQGFDSITGEPFSPEHPAIGSILAEFNDTVSVYGIPAISDIVGAFVVKINSDGILTIQSFHDEASARQQYAACMAVYTEWLDIETD